MLLVPPGSYHARMPNLGDRALHQGMKALLEATHDGGLVYDEWNSFPHKTLSRLRASRQSPARRFQAWYEEYARSAAKPYRLQRKAAQMILGNGLNWTPLWPALDALAAGATGQTGREALAPRLFPGLYAQRYARKLETCEAVVMNAGGLFADHLSRYLPGRVFALHVAQKAGLRTALLNYSFAVSSADLLSWVAPVIRLVDIHAVREDQSRERLVELGVCPEKIRVVPDAAFAMPVEVPRYSPGSRPLIALQIRGDRRRNTRDWAHLVSELGKRFGARVIYLAGCLKHDRNLPAVLTQQANYEAVDGVVTEQVLLQHIAAADVLISDRYHGLIFATRTGTPFVPIESTTHKTEGYVNSLDYPFEVHSPPGEGNMDSILVDVAKALEQRSDISRSLSEQARRLEGSIYADYRDIMTRLRASPGNKSFQE